MSAILERQGFLHRDAESWHTGCTCGAKMRPRDRVDGGARLACEADDCDATMLAFSEVLGQ